MSTPKPFPFLPDQQCTNVCITMEACDNANDKPGCYKHGAYTVQSCIQQCMEGKDKPNTPWKNMISVYGPNYPNLHPDKQYCDAVYKNMQPSK